MDWGANNASSTWGSWGTSASANENELPVDTYMKGNNLSSSFYKALFSENSDETTKKLLTYFGNFMSKNNPAYKTMEEELTRSVKEMYQNISSKGNGPLESLLKRIMNLYQSSTDYGVNAAVPRILMKVLGIVKNEYRNDFNANIKAIGHLHWTKVDPIHLKNFLQTFEIADEVDMKELLPKVNLLKSQNKLSEVANYISAAQLQSHFDVKELVRLFIDQNKARDAAFLAKEDFDLQKLFVSEMCKRKDASKAADFVKEFKRDPTDFPELIEVLDKNSLRYHSYKEHWVKVEEKFYDFKHILGYYVEMLIDDGKYDEALSIVKRHNLLKLGSIKRENIVEEISPYFANPPRKHFKYFENILFTKDEYTATEEILNKHERGVYLKLTDLGLNPDADIIWVENYDDVIYKGATADILSSKVIGMDTEYRFVISKFDSSETSILQIATEKKIYIFDLKKLANIAQYQEFVKDMLSRDEPLKIGHTLTNDVGFIKDGVKVIKGNVDIAKLYKAVYSDAKQTKLSTICETTWNKPLSKSEQISNWDKRPLRKAQLHYAAMDAYVLIKLYEKLKGQLEKQGKSVEKFVENTTRAAQGEGKKAKKNQEHSEEKSEEK